LLSIFCLPAKANPRFFEEERNTRRVVNRKNPRKEEEMGVAIA
jgi:hypothetical protein